ncbi:MAG: YjbQ family protein [Acidobacteria bacterium]|nr:YjbQ family protein [Acidobacteriota bacterium]
MTSIHVLELKTKRRNQLLDLMPEIRAFLRECRAAEGMLILFVPHTTAAVTINENADPDVKTDILSYLSRLIPENAGFRHMEGNSDAHIKSSLVSPSLTILVSDGNPVLGTWQSVFFCEFDGPRTRKLYLKYIPDPS